MNQDRMITEPEVSEFKGHSVLSLPNGGGYAFSFGLGKAKLIVDNWDKIEAFVQSRGKDTAGAAIDFYKNKPMIVLNPEARFQFKFGLGKAETILENGQVIRRFIESDGRFCDSPGTWIDPAGGIHDDDEEDPARMYE